MAGKNKIKNVYKNGFNLLDTYPIEFSETVETIEYDGDIQPFDFQFPDKKIENIIVTLFHTEPWALPGSVVLENGIRDFLNKLDNVREKHFPESHCHVIVNAQDTNFVNESKRYRGNGDWLNVHSLEPIYPNDAPVLLLKNILGLDLAFGRDAMDLGVLLLGPQSVLGIFERYIQENEYNACLMPVSGTGLKKNKILKVKPGTPIQSLLNGNIKEGIKCGVFVDGPLNGTEIKDLSQKIEWSTKNIVVLEDKDYKIAFPFIKLNELLFTTSLIGELRRCVYCNYCDDICPVGLEPALFWHCYSRGEKQKTRLYALEKCIECGLCSYICPSKLELFQVIKECKLALSGR